MATYIYLGYGTIQIVLLVMAIGLLLKYQKAAYLFISLALLGLAYDNLIIGLGLFIGEGDLLKSLNFPRYAIHALLTPLLIMAGLYLARYAEVGWAWGKKMTYFFMGITGVMILMGVYTDIVTLQLQPAFENGALRYINAAAAGPPIPAVVTILLLIICGIGMAVSKKWAWLLVGSIIMFITSAGGAAFGIITNIGEITLAAGLVFTARRFAPISYQQYLDAQPVLSSAEKLAKAQKIRARKRNMAVYNRRMAWITFPVLVIGTVAYYQTELGLSLPDWMNPVFNSLFIVLFFLHTAASFYLYGVPRPRKNIRVVHIYIGYGVFLFTMVSQSLIGMEPIHLITYIINWVFILAHLSLSTRFMYKRVFKKRPEILEVSVSKKYDTSREIVPEEA